MLFSRDHGASLIPVVWIVAVLMILDAFGYLHINNYKLLCLLFITAYIISVVLQLFNRK